VGPEHRLRSEMMSRSSSHPTEKDRYQDRLPKIVLLTQDLRVMPIKAVASRRTLSQSRSRKGLWSLEALVSPVSREGLGWCENERREKTT
jgi:hypothetical protein